MAKPQTKTMTLGKRTSLRLDEIKPYWRNPRLVSDDAINQLIESIRRYGYQQPIVVDAEHVIIAGHTRYAALRRMDVEEVPVIVATTLTPEQVKAYRLIDNRSGEFSDWNFGQLMDEIGALDIEMLEGFFPEARWSIDNDSDDIEDWRQASVAAKLAEAEEQLAKDWESIIPEVEFTCPDCFHRWEVKVTREAIFSGIIKGTS